MAETLFGLTEAQVERLGRLLSTVEGESSPPVNGANRRPLLAARVVIGALTSSVAATTALLGKPKVGELNVYTFSSTGTVDTGIDIPCYNFAPNAATTDRWTVCERDNMTGKWIITTQYCS